MFRRNDVTGYVLAIDRLSSTLTGSFTCNYWGQASGASPVGAGIPLSFHNPFSIVLIANQPAVLCNPLGPPTP